MGKKGFSLIEVVIFVSILSMLFVVAASVSSASIRNMKISEHKMIASYYADELMEWLRYQKTSDWQVFSGHTQTSTYCFSALNWGNALPCTRVGTLYKRQATFINNANPATSIKVQIDVQWNEIGSTPYSISQKNLFTIYE